MLDVIKEYLISLGFQVNSNSLNQANNAMHQADAMVSRFAGNSIKSFGAAGAAVTTFVAAANLALAKFMNDLAEAELRSQMWARAMYTTADNAMAVTNSLNAMGRSMEELYLSPELIKQFQELRQQSFAMRPPDEYREQMKFIRSIGFEFVRLKLEVQYAMQWVAFYVFKYLEGPIRQIKQGMKDFNDSIMKSMPKWTKQIAQVVSWVGRLGLALFKAGQVIYKLFKEIPNSVKLAGGSFLTFFTLLKMGPIGWIIAGLTALLLVIDDFATYQRSGKSAFAGLWEKIDPKVFDNVGELKDSFFQLLDAVIKLGGALTDLVIEFAKLLGQEDVSKFINDVLIKDLQGLKATVDGVTAAIRALTDLLNCDFSKAMDGLSKSFSAEKLDKILGLIGPPGTSIGGQIGGYLGGKINDYIRPKAQKNSFNTNQTNTFNVYGNDAYATASLVSKNMNSLNTRNFQSVFT